MLNTCIPVFVRKNYYILLIIFTLISKQIFAQQDSLSNNPEVVSSDWIDQGISLGIGLPNYVYGEFGYYRSIIWEAGGFPAISNTMNFSVEFSYFDKIVLAPKVQGRIHLYFFNASLSALYYSDLEKQYAIKLRPEVGIGLWNFDINYGYNFGIFKNDFERINKHVISIRYYWRLKRKYLNEYDAKGNRVVR
jgi:hypothetical protein